ncbi:ROK family protein [Candidatus Binatia bacterium]|nr:ROK family protein [Candidatus Binatia bacterium]
MAKKAAKRASGDRRTAGRRTVRKPRVVRETQRAAAGPRTLAIDIGGTGLKMLVLDPHGKPVNERGRIATPQPATPASVLRALKTLIATQPPFDRVSVGFPGVVHDGVVKTAPNLASSWQGHDLAQALRTATRKPVRVCNDADVQGLGDIDGKGVELVLTLGTGLGSALFVDGRLVPNLELGHHPFRHGKTYEELVGKAALEKSGKKRWRKHVREALAQLDPIFNYRTIYLGGGNAKLLKPSDLPKNARITSNEAGLLGGIALWR